MILNLYGKTFHPMVVLGPEHDFLFKSASTYCVPFEKLQGQLDLEVQKVSIYVNSFFRIRTKVGLSKDLWSNLIQFEPIWTDFIWLEPNNQADPTWSDLIWTNLIQLDLIWSNMTNWIQLDLIWSNMTNLIWFDLIWTKLSKLVSKVSRKQNMTNFKKYKQDCSCLEKHSI